MSGRPVLYKIRGSLAANPLIEGENTRDEHASGEQANEKQANSFEKLQGCRFGCLHALQGYTSLISLLIGEILQLSLSPVVSRRNISTNPPESPECRSVRTLYPNAWHIYCTPHVRGVTIYSEILSSARREDNRPVLDFKRMRLLRCPFRYILFSLLLGSAGSACAQQGTTSIAPGAAMSIRVTVVDETGQSIAGARVSVREQGKSPIELWTDYAGHCAFTLHQDAPYQVVSSKPGFYLSVLSDIDPTEGSIRIAMTHEQIVQEQVNVTDSVPGIDVEQTSDGFTMNTPEIVNVPYPTSREIRNLLPFNPGVVATGTAQVHVAGSETWESLDQIDGFDVRSPLRGVLSIRVSTDAVRTINAETTRYPVEFGRATGGVIAIYTGMGDHKFRFNATNFIPSFRNLNGFRFDKTVPRFTFSGPLIRDRAWFYDGLETEYDNIYIVELPLNANSNQLIRGSNLIKVQANLAPSNILIGGLIINGYHSPYDGISSLTPQQSTTKRDTAAWFPYLRDKWSFAGGALLDVGVSAIHVRDGYEPHGNTPYQITPESSAGSYFENLTGRSQREEGTAGLFLPPQKWTGLHNLKFGVDLRHTGYTENVSRASISYLREDKSLLRRSDYPAIAPFTLNNVEVGAYAQDRWQPRKGLLVSPGCVLIGMKLFGGH